MNKILKKTIATVLLMAIIVTNLPIYAIARVDTTRPSMMITNISSKTVVEEGDNLTFTVYFDDEMAMGEVKMTNTDVVLSGFTGTPSVSGSGNTRTVTISNVKDAEGENKITILEGAAKDAAGNVSAAVVIAGFSIKAKVVKDTTSPSVMIVGPDYNVVEVGGTVKYTVTFSDERSLDKVNVSENSFELVGFNATVKLGEVTTTKNGDKSVVVTLENIQGTVGSDKHIKVKPEVAQDAAENKSNGATSSSFELKAKAVKDTTRPSVMIVGPDYNVVEVGGTVKYTVTFSDERSLDKVNVSKNSFELVGFDADIELGKVTTTKNGDKSVVVTLENIQGAVGSNKYIKVKSEVAIDAAGNKSNGATSLSFKLKAKAVKDTTRPSVMIVGPEGKVVEVGGTVKYTVTFSDERSLDKVNVSANSFELVGFDADIELGKVTTKNTGDKFVVVTLKNIQGTVGSNKYIKVKPEVAIDAAGNKSNGATSLSFELKAKAVKDTTRPLVKIASVKPASVLVGGTVTYVVTFTDNVAVTAVNLYESKITTVGFTADVSVKQNGVKSAEITLKNIQGTVGSNKYIKIASGVALDKQGNRSEEVTSMKFSIAKKSSEVSNTTTNVINTANCIDDLELLGDINKEITYFASWLRAEKYTAAYPQENNYVVEDDTMTYMVEYFNGSTAPAPDVNFELTIPYKVAVEEINGAGKITKQTENETVITWNMGTVNSYVESKGTGFCRLYVRVRFAENTKLAQSENISEVFYATLKTTAGGNDSYSYIRQLFIDLTEGKTGTYNKYLTAIDTTNQVRPYDEITRAEFAKLLADAGIIKVEIGSKEYKAFKDYETIPSYARDAVSALTKTDIIQAFPDGTFKPNNPILVEDAIQMLAQASLYMSEQKLTINKPVFIYTEALKGKDGEVSPKQDYIMELIRQNVIGKTDIKPDTYALRKDVVAMVNSLTFRGPYVETLPENTLKFADIRDDSVVFYNIVGAANSYVYRYDHRLWQKIVDVK